MKFKKEFTKDTSVNWDQNNVYNKMFIQGVINMMNDQLRFEGYVFVGEFFKALGLPITKESLIRGWVISRDKHVKIKMIPIKGGYLLKIKAKKIIDDFMEES